MKKRILPLTVVLLIFTAISLVGCQESLEDRCAREAREFTQKKCPVQIDAHIVMDSMTFDKSTHTIGYAYTIDGPLDDADLIKSSDTRSMLLTEIKNSANMKLYKEAGYSFRYIYHSAKNKGARLFDATFTEKDYR